MENGSSLIEALEVAKDLARSGQYLTAVGYFEPILEASYPSTIDVWTDAAQALAECQRLLGRWEVAIELYAKILRNRPRAARSGRFARTNANSALMSLFALIDMGRHSLMVESGILHEMLERGRAWAAEEFSPELIRPMFQLVAAFIARNEEGPARAITLLRELLSTPPSKLSPQEVTSADHTILRFHLAETLCDARLWCDVPGRVDDAHFAARWCNQMIKLLELRNVVLSEPSRTVGPWLSQRRFFDESVLESASDLDLLQRRLEYEIASTRDVEGACERWWAAIVRRDGTGAIADHANPTWHRLALTRLVTERGEGQGVLRHLASASLERTQRLLAIPQLQAVLRSRGITSGEVTEFLGAHVSTIQPELLARLAMVVRP